MQQSKPRIRNEGGLVTDIRTKADQISFGWWCAGRIAVMDNSVARMSVFSKTIELDHFLRRFSVISCSYSA